MRTSLSRKTWDRLHRVELVLRAAFFVCLALGLGLKIAAATLAFVVVAPVFLLMFVALLILDPPDLLD